jgi:hypothetical protein
MNLISKELANYISSFYHVSKYRVCLVSQEGGCPVGLDANLPKESRCSNPR